MNNEAVIQFLLKRVVEQLERHKADPRVVMLLEAIAEFLHPAPVVSAADQP